MNYIKLIFSVVCLAALFSISACELFAPKEETAPLVYMEYPAFDAALLSAKNTRPASASERRLGELMDQNLLTTDMKAQALFARGNVRRMNRLNLQAGLKDFDEMLRIAPNHALANNARTERRYLQTDISRLSSNSNGRLQTIAEWFDGAWATGNRDAAARRYKKSGLSPTQPQVSQLVSAGYICRGSGQGGDVYKYGDRRSDLNGLKWCRKTI